MKIRPIPNDAIDLVKSSERCELVAYLDCVGVPTIGWGYTHGVTLGMEISQEDADAYLYQELGNVAAAVLRLTKVPIDDDQYAALIDFVYNEGAGRYQASTIRSRLNRGDYIGAANYFMKYVFAGGRVFKGLEIRRKKEYNLFIKNMKSSYN